MIKQLDKKNQRLKDQIEEEDAKLREKDREVRLKEIAIRDLKNSK